MIVRYVAVAVILLSIGCGRVSDSSLAGLGESDKGHNVATIFGAPKNLEGVPTDVRELGAMFRSSDSRFRFQSVISNAKATTQIIFDKTAAGALTADSLLWVFSGHGNTGIMLGEDKTFTFREVADVIKATRRNKPLRRLVVFIDACYSGSFVDGSTPIITEPAGSRATTKCAPRGEDLTARADEAGENVMDVIEEMAGDLYKEAFVMSASTKSETSVDLGAEKGGAFTYAMRMVIDEFRTTGVDPTIDEFAKATVRRTQSVGNHTPVYRAFPNAVVLSDKLFGY